MLEDHEREELARRLEDFGLTLNQAMVYLTIVQSGTATVDRIAQYTKLYRQDIYKMMPKLQRMGLITKTLGKPAKFEALPVKMALENLLTTKKKEAEEKILRLSTDIRELTDSVKHFQTGKLLKEDEPHFSLLTTDFELKNKFDTSFDRARKQFCVVSTPDLAPNIINIISERARAIAKKGVETRIIIESSVDEATRKFLDKVDRAHDCIIAKQVRDATLVPYRIFDDEEVWISLKKEIKSGTPWFLWTDAPNIVKFYKKSFERLWTSPEAKSL